MLRTIYQGAAAEEPEGAPAKDEARLAASLVSLVEETHGAKVFNVGLALDLEKERANVTSWSAPSLVVIRGTDLGVGDQRSDSVLTESACHGYAA